ncbi:hypothetical protein Gohar_021737 [Gossypium harknessii]|uniref:RNase H type-1 domain-containing protein n=1 Tax=Gossypium harknessii TaxID=34285 RepID=A0A7J9I7S6_9ROSI|nr:hypothetical protein [Gossypium harknessii]
MADKWSTVVVLRWLSSERITMGDGFLTIIDLWESVLSLDAILWGIRDDLMIALDRGSNRLIILLDNQEAVQAIQGSSTKALNSALVRRI